MQSAIDYAKGAKFGPGEIRVLGKDGSVESVIAFDKNDEPHVI